MVINNRKIEKLKACIKLNRKYLRCIFIREHNVQICKYFKINIEELFLIQFIFEGHEGLVTITTLDVDKGLIKVSFSSDSLNDIDHIIKALKKDFYLADTNQYE